MKSFVCAKCGSKFYSASDENLKCDSCGAELIEVKNDN